MTRKALVGWIWRDHLRARIGLLSAATAFMVIEGSSVAALSALIRPLFDQVFVGGDRGAVIWVALAVAGVFVARAAAGFAQRVLIARLGESFVADLQRDLLRHLLTLDAAFYQTHPPGHLIERVRGDTSALRTLFSTILVALGRDLVSLVALLGVALWIDWRWTAVAVIGVPLIVAPVVVLQGHVRRTAASAREAAAVLSTRLDEVFHGIATVQLTGTQPREERRFGDALRTYVRAQLRSETGAAAIPALIDLVAALGFAGVMAYGGLQIIAGTKTVGEFMSFFTALALVFDPLRRLGSVSGAWAQARASLERLSALQDRQTAIRSPDTPLPLTPGDLVLDDVTFGYDPAQPVLRGVSLTARAGEMTALVGPSGAGKSTVFALIARFADPQSGRITLGGTDLAALDVSDLRAHLSVVSQSATLFDEPLRDNIAMGRADVTDEAIATALDAAGAAEFVARLPLGVQSFAGPRGSALSGGQRQRIAIARALLADAPVLLLDEATSALDPATEALVTAALDRLAQGRTTLVIAHRLATVERAHHIVVLDEGRVVETGTHADLLAAGGTYAHLHALQFRPAKDRP